MVNNITVVGCSFFNYRLLPPTYRLCDLAAVEFVSKIKEILGFVYTEFAHGNEGSED